MKLLLLTLATLHCNGQIYVQNIKPTAELVEKVYIESDAESISFVGVEETFLSYFLKTNSNIPAIVFDINRTNISWIKSNQLYGHVLIVARAIRQDPDTIAVLNQLILQLGLRNYALVIADNLEDLQTFFLYFWKQKFRRIFGIVNSTSYAFFPFADSKIVEFTVDYNPLPDVLKNLNGHVLRTSIKLDVPRAFWYTEKNGTRKIGGFVARVLTNFLRKYNGTLKNGLENNFDKGKEIQLVVKGVLDVALNPYIPHKGIELSYPVKLSRWTIMVPLKGFLHPNEYFLRPFSSTVWSCIGITCIYIAVMNILTNIITGLPANVWHSCTQIYLTMLNSSLERTNTSPYRIQFIQKVFAFITVNFYLVFLTSFLTIFIKVKEYDSVQELIDDGFPVMMSEYDLNVTDSKIFPKDFKKIVAIVPSAELTKARYSMRNTSYAYGIGIDAFSFLHSLTMRYSKPKFKLISKSMNQALYGFLWSYHAQLREVLSQFIIRIADYGLMIKWTEDSVMQGAEIVKKYMNLTPDPVNVLFALKASQLQFAWNCLFFGLILATVVFFVEKYPVFWWINRRMQKQNH